MRTLLETFPREIGYPKRQKDVIKNRDEFYKQINQYNGRKTIFYSVYDCDEFHNYDKCTIDKVFFDFDGEKALADTISLSDWCIKNNLKHLILFSGNKGFHLYIFVAPSELKHNKRDVLYNAHKYVEKEVNVEIDKHVMGDIARFGRVPNTTHLTSRLYCIPVTRIDLNGGLDAIKEKAKKQNFTFTYYGEGLLSLSDFDNQTYRRDVDMETYEYKFNETINEDIVVQTFPACVKCWLTDNSMCKNDSRYYFAVYCLHMGIPDELVHKIAQKYFGEMKETGGPRTKYREFIDEKAMIYAKKKEGIVPGCEALYKKGLCKGKCPLYKRDGFPIYR